MALKIYTDGGGQPGDDVGGPMAYAYVAEIDGEYIGSRSGRARGTNNEAEYNGVLLALNDLTEGTIVDLNEINEVTFVSDSQLVVYHLNKLWKAKNPVMRNLRDSALGIVANLSFPVLFTWERREYNKNADQLCTYTILHGPKLDFHTPIPKRPTPSQLRKGLRHGERLNNPS